MTPRWQRARILICPIPEIAGAEIWVEVGPPTLREGNYVDTLSPTGLRAAYWTNLIVGDPNFREQRMDVDKRGVELLSRDERDFAETVESIRYDVFLAQRRRLIAIQKERQ